MALVLAVASITALAAGPRYRIEVAGLACPFCAYGIEKKLGGLDGVESVETHIKEGVVIVTMADGATLEAVAVEEAVKAAGFTPGGLERAAPGDGQ